MMAQESSLIDHHGNKLWRFLEALIPITVLFLIPLTLPFVRRAGPLLFSVAAVLALACILRDPKARREPLRLNILGFCLVFFFSWTVVTLFWSPWPERGLFSILAGAEIVLASLVLLMWSSKLISIFRLYLMTACGLAFASILIFIDLKTGTPLLYLTNARPDTFRYNMVLVSLLPLSIVLWPARKSESWSIFRVVAFLSFAAATFVSESETAKVALLIAISVYFFVLLLPQKFSYLIMVIMVLAAWIVAPFLSDILVHGKVFLGSFWDSGHASERIKIWSGFSEMARAGLPWGWGVDASPAASLTSFFKQASAETQKNISWLHPHSMPLQIYVELGWPGVFFAGLASILALPRYHRVPQAVWAQKCAIVAVVFAVAMISHGLWQTWWWVGVAISIYGLKIFDAEDGA